MATYNDVKKIKFGNDIFNLYDSGGTITKITTTAGAHTTVDKSSGAVSFNVPTKTSHLTNDSGFITSIANNITGSGTSGSIAKFNGSNTITSGPAFGSSTTTFLRNDGEWASVPSSYTLPVATNTTLGGVKPWYTHTATSTGPTTGNNATAVAVNAISTTSNRYYAVEADNQGRMFVNVPWADTAAYVSKSESTYTVSAANTSTIPIGISGFDATTNILFVDVNGLDLVQGTDYTISGTNIVLTSPISTVGTKVHFMVLKLVAASAGDYGSLKGEKGDKGDKGDTGSTGQAAGFGTPTASVTNTVGTPGVTITASGSNTSKVFNFAFTNLKGEKGDKGDKGIDGTHNISYTSLITSGQQAGTLTIDGVSTPVYANVVWG